MGHAHAHRLRSAQDEQRLKLVLGLSAGVMVVELVASWLTGSLALLADAGHMLTDVAGLGMSVGAIIAARSVSSTRNSYGFYRLEILAAAANAVLLLGLALWVTVAAIHRLSSPSDVDSGPMFAVACLGLLANIAGLGLLHRGQGSGDSSSHGPSLNLRGARLEVLGDLFGSLAVIVAALIIAFTGYVQADPIASLVIGVLIVPRTWTLLREAVDVLLEATPRHIDLDHIRTHIQGVEGVEAVHDLHVWTITSGMAVMSAHVVVTDDALGRGQGVILDRLGACLSDHFDVEHSTFQIEPRGHTDHELPVHP